MYAEGSSESSVPTYQSTRYPAHEDNTFHIFTKLHVKYCVLFAVYDIDLDYKVYAYIVKHNMWK